MQDDNQTRERPWALVKNHRDTDALQSRPMTTIEHVASGRPPRNIGEHRDVPLGRRS